MVPTEELAFFVSCTIFNWGMFLQYFLFLHLKCRVLRKYNPTKTAKDPSGMMKLPIIHVKLWSETAFVKK